MKITRNRLNLSTIVIRIVANIIPRYPVKKATGHNGDNKMTTAKTATHNMESSQNGDNNT